MEESQSHKLSIGQIKDTRIADAVYMSSGTLDFSVLPFIYESRTHANDDFHRSLQLTTSCAALRSKKRQTETHHGDGDWTFEDTF